MGKVIFILISVLTIYLQNAFPFERSDDSPSVYFVGGENASDTNPGTIDAPFATISKAAEILLSRDTCYIRAGTYRETVIPQADGVTFKSYGDEYVVITGLDVVTGWSSYQGNVVKAAFTRETPEIFKASQVFVNGSRMNWARYPNEDGDMLNREDMEAVTVKNTSLNNNYAEVAIDGLPSQSKNYWAGAYFIGVNDSSNWFTANKGRVIGTEGNSLTGSDLCMKFRDGKGLGYLIGHLGLLDAEKEWHLQNDTLYLYPPSGSDMGDALIEARKRIFGFDLTGRTGVLLQGIHFKAAALNMENAMNCTVDKCTFRYASSFTSAFISHGDWKNGDASIHVSGNNNTIKNSYIGRTWGTGVSLWGDHNTVENCIIEQCNWMGERMAPVFAPGDDNIIRRNTIRYAAREGIELGNESLKVNKYAKRALIQYNHVHHLGYFCNDGGVLYTNHQGGANPVANTEISYNVWHDYFSHPTRDHGGIYLDNGSSGYTIHHNVIWNVGKGVYINDFTEDQNPHSIFIYHNTILDTWSGYAVMRWLNRRESTKGYVVTRNNHSNVAGFDGNWVDHNRENMPLSEFVDADTKNYRLMPSSLSVDKGVALPGINDAAINAPDLGAYEYGIKDWTAGADILVPDFPDEIEYD